MALSEREIVEKLKVLKLFDFWKSRTLTEEQRVWLNTLCQRYLSGSRQYRRQLRAMTPKETYFLFDLCAQSLATEAVRETNAEKVKLGLVAVAIKEGGIDFRDSLSLLTLLYHSAGKIGLDPLELFRQAAHISSDRAAELFLGFLTRSSQDRDIARFGYKEGQDDEGRFVYVAS